MQQDPNSQASNAEAHASDQATAYWLPRPRKLLLGCDGWPYNQHTWLAWPGVPTAYAAGGRRQAL